MGIPTGKYWEGLLDNFRTKRGAVEKEIKTFSTAPLLC